MEGEEDEALNVSKPIGEVKDGSLLVLSEEEARDTEKLDNTESKSESVEARTDSPPQLDGRTSSGDVIEGAEVKFGLPKYEETENKDVAEVPEEEVAADAEEFAATVDAPVGDVVEEVIATDATREPADVLEETVAAVTAEGAVISMSENAQVAPVAEVLETEVVDGVHLVEVEKEKDMVSHARGVVLNRGDVTEFAEGEDVVEVADMTEVAREGLFGIAEKTEMGDSVEEMEVLENEGASNKVEEADLAGQVEETERVHVDEVTGGREEAEWKGVDEEKEAVEGKIETEVAEESVETGGVEEEVETGEAEEKDETEEAEEKVETEGVEEEKKRGVDEAENQLVAKEDEAGGHVEEATGKGGEEEVKLEGEDAEGKEEEMKGEETEADEENGDVAGTADEMMETEVLDEADVMEETTEAEETEALDEAEGMEVVEDAIELVSGGKRKRGKNLKAPIKVSSRKKVEEDVCFICFDGGELVLCDRR